MLIRNTFASIMLMLASLVAYSAEEEKADNALIVEAQVSHQASRSKDVQRSLTSALLHIEKPISEDHSVFANAYADQEFKSVGVGIAKKFGDFQLAVGVGKAYYDGTSHTMPHGFVYYANGDDEGLLHVEKYLGETVDPVFVKGYFTRKFGSWIAGVYGETGMGVGPLVGYTFTENMKLTFTVPIAARPHKDDGDMRFKVTLIATF